jgi:AcrR family transcriptional regulator
LTGCDGARYSTGLSARAQRPRDGRAKSAAARATRRRSAARPAPHTSRKEQGEITRRAILEAAVALYAEAGARGTGLMAIGKRAGVHHATVLYHFKSSRDLLLAVLDERDRRFVAFSQDVLHEGGLAALERLPYVGRFNVEFPVWAKLFTVLQAENLDPDAEAYDYFACRRNEGREMTLRLLRTAKERGEIRDDADEETVADMILAFTAGINVQYFLDPKRVDMRAAYQRFTAMVIADLTRGVGANRKGKR